MGELAAAGSLLTQMMREADGLPPPDACSYNTVIAAMSHTQPNKAEALLTTMLDTGLAATEISFTSVIVAYAKVRVVVVVVVVVGTSVAYAKVRVG